MNSDSLEDLNKSLLQVSEAIEYLVLNLDENPTVLNNVESWIKIHYERIQHHRNQQENNVVRNLLNQETRDNALFIFDSSFQIITYSGTQDFFSQPIQSESKTLNLLDIINEADHAALKLFLAQATKDDVSAKIDLHIKSDMNVLNKGTFELDMSTSNPEKDRFVAKLNFTEIMTSQLLEYQTLILDNLPGMDIYLFDKNFIYLFAGGREKERFELNNAEFIGKSVFDVLDKKSVRLIYPYISKALQGIDNEGEIRYEDEVYFMKGSPVKDYKNETIGAILFSQNITTDKELEEQLKKSREDALNADKLKSIFIANISHEIRTPLNAIIGFTELLGKSNITKEQERFITFINKASDHLLYLVTEVVYLFKLGMGKIYLEKSPFSTLDLIDELKEAFHKQAIDKHLFFNINCDHHFPELLIGDSFRLRQILTNLLVNAIKYTDRGGVIMNCKIKNETDIGLDILFEVIDTGVGISSEDQQTIFNVFEQGNKLNANFRGGAGLGLGICKNLVELLGGRITVKSQVMIGSTFTVQLPFDKATCNHSLGPRIIDQQYKTSDKLLAGKKILLADDDEHNRILAEYILKGWEADYVLVEDGQEAIDCIAKEKFDIALIDIHMPNKNGIDVVQFARSNNHGVNYKTPIIFMTANAFKSDTSIYMKAGFDDYLIKPFREGDLYNKLCSILQVEQSAQNYTTQMIDNDSHASTRSELFNTNELTKTANGDHAFFNSMINNFISNAEALVAVLANGVATESWQEMGEKAHKSIPSFKFFQLFKTARSLEIIEHKTLRNIDYKSVKSIIQQTITMINDAIRQAKSSF